MVTATNNYALNIDTVLNGSGIKYKIIDVLGQGGFGITYLAVGEVVVNNIPGEMKFAIKEHFPSSVCKRKGQDVVVDEDKLNTFKSSLSDFISEAKKLHSLGIQNENIVKVNEVFEENGTAYYVMQYINGDSLASYVKSKGSLPYHEAIGLLSPIFDAVDFLHKSRINHLDIKPENIMLHRGMDGLTPILIDFGLSVHFKKNGGKTSPKGVEGVSEGYSPLEQYAGIKEFNPPTDIYALATTLLFVITGKTPKNAAELRLSEIRSGLARVVPQSAMDGLCRALRQSSEDRTSSIDILKADLGVTSGGGSLTDILDRNKEKKKQYFRAVLIGSALLLSVIIVVVLINIKSIHSNPIIEPRSFDSMQIDSIVVDDQQEKISEEPYEEIEKAQKTDFNNKKKDEQEKTQPMPNPNIPEVAQKTEVTDVIDGTLHLGYGTWKGGIRNGKPDGKGQIIFTSSHKVDRSSSAEGNPGDYFIATYDNGSLISGKLYDSGGNLLQTIIP